MSPWAHHVGSVMKGRGMALQAKSLWLGEMKAFASKRLLSPLVEAPLANVVGAVQVGDCRAQQLTFRLGCHTANELRLCCGR